MALDKTKALDDFRISEELYDEMLEEFAVQADEIMAVIERALNSGNTGEAAEQAHSLKGAAGNMRLDECYNVVRAIELAIRSSSRVQVAKELSKLRDAVGEIRAAIVKKTGA